MVRKTLVCAAFVLITVGCGKDIVTPSPAPQAAAQVTAPEKPKPEWVEAAPPASDTDLPPAVPALEEPPLRAKPQTSSVMEWVKGLETFHQGKELLEEAKKFHAAGYNAREFEKISSLLRSVRGFKEGHAEVDVFSDAEVKERTESLLKQGVAADWFLKVHAAASARFERKKREYYGTEANFIRNVTIIAEKQTSLKDFNQVADRLLGRNFVRPEWELSKLSDVARVLEHKIPAEKFEAALDYTETFKTKKHKGVSLLISNEPLSAAIELSRSKHSVEELKPLFDYVIALTDLDDKILSMDHARIVRRLYEENETVDVPALKETYNELLNLKEKDGARSFSGEAAFFEALRIQGVTLKPGNG